MFDLKTCLAEKNKESKGNEFWCDEYFYGCTKKNKDNRSDVIEEHFDIYKSVQRKKFFFEIYLLVHITKGHSEQIENYK